MANYCGNKILEKQEACSQPAYPQPVRLDFAILKLRIRVYLRSICVYLRLIIRVYPCLPAGRRAEIRVISDCCKATMIRCNN